MKALSTDDVSLELLREFGHDLGPEFAFEIEEGVLSFYQLNHRHGFA
jgi:hypothetical protein